MESDFFDIAIEVLAYIGAGIAFFLIASLFL